jgi:hypothetical protein
MKRRPEPDTIDLSSHFERHADIEVNGATRL